MRSTISSASNASGKIRRLQLAQLLKPCLAMVAIRDDRLEPSTISGVTRDLNPRAHAAMVACRIPDCSLWNGRGSCC